MNNKEKIKYFYEYITTNNLIKEVPEYVSDECAIRLGEKTIPVGVAGMQQHLIDVRKTYPDLKMTIISQYCDEDYVISEFVMEGTHSGEWLGMKPSGKKLCIAGVNIDKIADGKIIEHGGAANTFEALFEANIICPTPLENETEEKQIIVGGLQMDKMIKIRNEEKTDYEKVEEITRKAFWNLYFPGCVEHYLVHIMRSHKDFLPELDFVLEVDHQIIGNIMYTKTKLIDESGEEKDILTFGPFCILPEFQRNGYGKKLLEHSFKRQSHLVMM